MAAYTKAFTGLTGMAVSKNPTHTLGVLYRYCKAIDDDNWIDTQILFQQEPESSGQDAS